MKSLQQLQGLWIATDAALLVDFFYKHYYCARKLTSGVHLDAQTSKRSGLFNEVFASKFDYYSVDSVDCHLPCLIVYFSKNDTIELTYKPKRSDTATSSYFCFSCY